MRVLFTCRPLTGHFEPLFPLAAAAARAGHDVAFATGAPVVGEARARGVEAFAAGPDASLRAQWVDRLPAREVLATDEGRAWFFTEVFAGLELTPRAEDLAGVIARWRPDVLVHELAELAGPLAATAAGLPYATAGYGILPSQAVVRAAGDAARAIWERHGVDPPDYAGLFRHLYLDVCPPTLQLPWVAELPAVQAVRAPVAAAAPLRLSFPYERTVYVTFGTVWNRDPEAFMSVLDGLAGEPLNVIVTTGSGVDLGPQPAHIHVAPFIPQAAVLPVCDAVICHGGSGTILGALAHGRPLLILPQGADQFANAERLAAVGAGIAGTPDSVRDATMTLLRDSRYERAAAALAAEIAAIPDADAAVAALEALA